MILHGFGTEDAHDFLVDGEHDTTRKNETRQPRGCTPPESEDALFAQGDRKAVERARVLGPRLQRLHSCLDHTVRSKERDRRANVLEEGERSGRGRGRKGGMVG